MSYKVTKKDVKSTFLRYFLANQICWNYETMQSPGVIMTLGPELKKIYADNPEKYAEAMESHFQFFNTQSFIGGVIMGATLAMEEDQSLDWKEKREAIASLKTGLMGPFAGLGDSLFFIIPSTIFNAMAAYSALNGSAAGLIPGALFGIAIIALRYWFVKVGYEQGTRFVSGLSGELKAITKAATILGMVVLGALIGSVVYIYIPITFSSGDYTTSIMDVFDGIAPNLLPMLFTVFVYWLLGRKNMTSTKAIFVILLIAFIGYNIGLLA